VERSTRQREAIRRALEEAGRPLTAEEILKAGRRHAPGLGIATVYRSIKAFVGAGWLEPVSLPDEPPRYEASAGKDHHHHFRCAGCHRVFELDGCVRDIRRLTPRGFRLERHEVVLYGRCRACARPT
jgi:Fur family ferric uptake transcriptional regulator